MLTYYKSQPSKLKQLDAPLGSWSCRNVYVYSMRWVTWRAHPFLHAFECSAIAIVIVVSCLSFTYLRVAFRHMKKAPRPNFCFCLKPATEPLWPSSKKEVPVAPACVEQVLTILVQQVLSMFENTCKFMCARSAAEVGACWLLC